MKKKVAAKPNKPKRPLRRKKADGAPSEAEARMQAILNTAVDGIIVIDEKGRVESYNPAAERIFGHPAKDVIGKNVSLLMPAPHRSKHNEYIRKYIRTGKARIIGIGREVMGLRADGTPIPIDLAVSEIRIGGRRTFTGIIRDISERKRLEKAIVDASEMERKQIGQDLHDTVSQHLAGLTMIARVLQQKIGRIEDERVADLAQEATNIAELADTALKQVKNISHGLYPVELERNGLGTALEQLANQQDALFQISCVYKSTYRLPSLDRTVSVHLYRIAQEAVSNAIKHASPRRIEIALDCTDTGLELTVRDDGKGMPRNAKSSSGLGLAIMQYRANMIGTELGLDSSPGRGTTITCVVPLIKSN